MTSQSTTQKKPLLILDMDETLLHGVDTEDKDKTKREPLPGLTVDFRVDSVLYYKRPHLDEFLSRMWKVYDIAVWSSAGAFYVESATRAYMAGHPEPLFVWSSNRCTQRVSFEPYYHTYNLKDLKRVWKRGFDKNRMLIVDDTPEKCLRNYGNAVYIKEFLGDQADEELLHLATYLESLADAPNFRTIEKRGWRNHP